MFTSGPLTFYFHSILKVISHETLISFFFVSAENLTMNLVITMEFQSKKWAAAGSSEVGGLHKCDMLRLTLRSEEGCV
jgi:hypothetical protein